ncbi:MAG: hypothetical protein HYV76_03075 [Candidatus Vogelbacteria bacterium]|nr:hypothetical protein [Candidatus Vogelbacteria bacterium]
MRRESLSFKSSEVEPSFLANYWRRLGLPGQPPRLGSVAESRLLDRCQAYTDLVLSGKNRIGREDERRRLHNELAVMIFGQTRTEMPYDLAEKISELACLATTGETLEQAFTRLAQARLDREQEDE